MNQNEAFAELVKVSPGWLDRPIEDLVKMAAVGSVYVTTHRALLSKIKSGQIELAEEDRKTKLAEGQAIGKALLDVEARIGELLPTAKEALANVAGKRGQPRSGPRPRSLPDDITEKRAQQARHIKDNPSAVAAIIKEAEENEDIPTKTAVLNKIKADKEKKLREDYERKTKTQKQENTAQTCGEALKYLSNLREVVLILPAKVPSEGWTDASFAEAQSMVAIIRKRLEAWK